MHSQNSSSSQDSSTAACKPKVIYTTLEVLEEGVPYYREPPKPEKCKWCGEPLYYEGLAFGGKILTWRNMPRRCSCQKAVEYWRKADAKEEEGRVKKEAEEREKKHREAMKLRISRSKMNRKYISCDFASFIEDEENRAAKRTAERYVENFCKNREKGIGLYIAGNCGTGKTHLSSAIALALMEKGHYVIAQSSIDILAAIKDSFERSGSGSEAVILPYMECDLLIIDDLGKEQCTPWSTSIIYRIINHRYNELKPTVINTNYDEQQLITRLTPSGDDDTAALAIMSRLHESSIGITMFGKDRRAM